MSILKQLIDSLSCGRL